MPAQQTSAAMIDATAQAAVRVVNATRKRQSAALQCGAGGAVDALVQLDHVVARYQPLGGMCYQCSRRRKTKGCHKADTKEDFVKFGQHHV
jgi:hypothetical protein